MKKKLILNKFSLRYLESFDVLSPYERAHRLGGPETMKNCKRNSIFSDFFSQNSNRKMLVFVTFLQKCFKIFRFVCGCYADIFECLGRDEGVFSPKVKKESKN